MVIDAPDLMKPKEVAEYLRVSTGTLTRWRRIGEGPEFLMVGGRVRYKKSDVSEFVNSGGSDAILP